MWIYVVHVEVIVFSRFVWPLYQPSSTVWCQYPKWSNPVVSFGGCWWLILYFLFENRSIAVSHCAIGAELWITHLGLEHVLTQWLDRNGVDLETTASIGHFVQCDSVGIVALEFLVFFAGRGFWHRWWRTAAQHLEEFLLIDQCTELICLCSWNKTFD